MTGLPDPRRIGIGEQFAAISRPALGLRLLDPDLRELAEFRRDPQPQSARLPQANMFDQPELEALLRSSLERHPMARLRMNSEVTDLGGLGDGRTRITFTDRADGSEHSLECDYLLGCDGANSLVRKHIGARMRDLRFEQRWLVVDVDSSVDLGQWDGVHQVCDPNRGGTFMRVGRSRYRWEFRLLPGESSEDFGSLAALRPLIAPWLGSVTDDRLLLIRVAEYTFRAQLADRWRRGNVFLLGDAGTSPPFIGQGLCAGLRDAMNLVGSLPVSSVATCPPRRSTPTRPRRKPHVRQLILLALTVGQVMTAGAGSVRRCAAFSRPAFDSSQAGGQASRLAYASVEPFGLVRSGRRPGSPRLQTGGNPVPNAVTATGERLDDVLGSGFALITTVPVTQEQKEAIEKRHVTIHFAPRERSWPDGCIATVPEPRSSGPTSP